MFPSPEITVNKELFVPKIINVHLYNVSKEKFSNNPNQNQHKYFQFSYSLLLIVLFLSNKVFVTTEPLTRLSIYLNSEKYDWI